MPRKCIRLFSGLCTRTNPWHLAIHNTWAWARFLAHVRYRSGGGITAITTMYWSQLDHHHSCMKFTSSLARERKTQNCKRLNAPFRMITFNLCLDIFRFKIQNCKCHFDGWWWKPVRSYCWMRNLKFDWLIWLVSVSFQISIGSERRQESVFLPLPQWETNCESCLGKNGWCILFSEFSLISGCLYRLASARRAAWKVRRRRASFTDEVRTRVKRERKSEVRRVPKSGSLGRNSTATHLCDSKRKHQTKHRRSSQNTVLHHSVHAFRLADIVLLHPTHQTPKQCTAIINSVIPCSCGVLLPVPSNVISFILLLLSFVLPCVCIGDVSLMVLLLLAIANKNKQQSVAIMISFTKTC